jgi:hypothetical protein
MHTVQYGMVHVHTRVDYGAIRVHQYFITLLLFLLLQQEMRYFSQGLYFSGITSIIISQHWR